ncbi:MAG: fasciclin domain-containing protein [Anaerolineae bacterium]|nr:fasciclin domain-containing protein [Anaerolineae bacterium]
MKVRLFAIVSLVAVLALAAVPAFAQDDMQTIADIVVSSSQAETPEFTVLLAAVQAADPSILELLASPDANVTVFAPTDAAFAAALEALGVSAEDLLADTELLNDVLLYHVVPGSFDAASVVALDGALLGTMLNETALAVSVDGDAVKVNDSTVVSADVMAANGIVHVIDAVLLPETGDDMMADDMGGDMMEPAGNIAEVVIASAGAETPEFTTLLAAVQAADPAILATLTGAGPYTVFAPTDAAFAAALEALGLTAEELLADTATLTSVLTYHVVPGHFAAETVVAVAGEDGGVNVATALPGTSVNIVASDMGVMVNDANVVTTDVHATNGIIHVIDAVLLPPSG